MSHHAIVAIQTGSNEYDIHHSPNGAYELYLSELLSENTANGTSDVSDFDTGDVHKIPELEKWNSHRDAHLDGDISVESQYADEPPINPEPMHTSVALQKVGLPINFDNIEAFYLVRDGSVETYLPVWAEPNVIRPWRVHLSVEVYRGGNLPSSPLEFSAAMKEADPLQVIDAETLAPSNNWLDDRIVSDVVLENHEYVYAMHHQMVTESKSEAEPQSQNTNRTKVSGLLATDSYHFSIRGPSDTTATQSPVGRGMFLRIPNANTSRYWGIVDDVNEARLETGSRLNVPNTLSNEDRSKALKNLVVEILAKHGDKIAPFSPPPFGELANELSSAPSNQPPQRAD